MWRWLIALATLPLVACATARAAEPPPAVWSWTRIVFDRDGIVESRAVGVADPRTGRPLGIDDPVRIASISKLIVALGVMRLVEQGQLDLDRDVSDWLGWRLRNPAHPDAPITLRHLLSHTSGLRDGDDLYVIPLGGAVRETLADPRVWDARAPGEAFAYANINFPVVASVMEMATGERFDRLMEREVFAPLGLDACFNWTTCPDARIARAVVLRDEQGAIVRDDLAGARPECPVVPDAAGGCDLSTYPPGSNGALFSPQGGARVSARDLTVIGRLFLNDGMHARRVFLSPAAMARMTAPVWRGVASGEFGEPGAFCAFGLAVHHLANDGCRDDPFGDGRPRIGHAGDAYGLLSGLWIDPASGLGVAYFVTGVADQRAPGRLSSFSAVEESLARGEELPVRR